MGWRYDLDQKISSAASRYRVVKLVYKYVYMLIELKKRKEESILVG